MIVYKGCLELKCLLNTLQNIICVKCVSVKWCSNWQTIISTISTSPLATSHCFFISGLLLWFDEKTVESKQKKNSLLVSSKEDWKSLQMQVSLGENLCGNTEHVTMPTFFVSSNIWDTQNLPAQAFFKISSWGSNAFILVDAGGTCYYCSSFWKK